MDATSSEWFCEHYAQNVSKFACYHHKQLFCYNKEAE